MPTAQFERSKLSVEETDDSGRDIGTYGPLQNGETADYLGVPTINTFYIGMNTSIRKNARKAVAHAFNQPDIANQIFKGRVSPAYHFTPKGIFPGGAGKYDSHAEENYPYSYGESNIEKARELMEADGYSENDMYEFTFTYYASGASTWGEMGERLRDQLQSAHIDMTLEEAPFSSLLSRGRQGNLEAYSLGWIMDWPAADNFLQNAHPPKTDTSQDGGATGLYVDWNQGAGRSVAMDAWETIQNNRGPGDDALAERQTAYLAMEEAMWEDMILLPSHHRTDERFLYQWVDWDKFGNGGLSRAKCNTVEIGERPN
jgi:peptide/nickel transport system substrate-binding protein